MSVDADVGNHELKAALAPMDILARPTDEAARAQIEVRVKQAQVVVSAFGVVVLLCHHFGQHLSYER